MKPVPSLSPLHTILSVLALAIAATVLSSCRTTEGFGEDLQKLGNKIENEAERRG